MPPDLIQFGGGWHFVSDELLAEGKGRFYNLSRDVNHPAQMGNKWLGPFWSKEDYFDKVHGGQDPSSLFVGIPSGSGNARIRIYNSGNRFGGGEGQFGGGLGNGFPGYGGGRSGGNPFGGMGGRHPGT